MFAGDDTDKYTLAASAAAPKLTSRAA